MYSVLLSLLLNKFVLFSIHITETWVSLARVKGDDPTWVLTHRLQRATIYSANCSLS